MLLPSQGEDVDNFWAQFCQAIRGTTHLKLLKLSHKYPTHVINAAFTARVDRVEMYRAVNY